jgi:hypothetical protein
MADQHVANFERHWLHDDCSRLYGLQRFRSGHAVRSGRDFDGAVLRPNPGQTEADDQNVRRQQQIGSLLEERPPVIDVSLLEFGAWQRDIAAPLVGDDPVTHYATNDPQHVLVEKEVRSVARRLEGHWEKVAMCTPVRLVTVIREMRH